MTRCYFYAALLTFALLQDIPVCSQVLPDFYPETQDTYTQEQMDEMGKAWEEYRMALPDILDLNDPDHLAFLKETGRLSLFQDSVLTAYIKQYGPLWSPYELGVLPGFSQQWLEAAGLTAVCEPHHSARRPLLKYKADFGSRIRYDGAAWGLRQTSRLGMEWSSQLRAQMVIDKDPGEPLLKKAGGQGPEHLSGFVAYIGKSGLKQLILGDYRVSHGYGLVFGQAFGSWDSRFAGAEGYSPVRIRPVATAMESTVMTGLAVQTGGSGWTLHWTVSDNHQDVRPSWNLNSWQLSGSNGGDHSTFPNQVRRNQTRIQRQAVLAVWEGSWYQGGVSIQHADVTALAEDTIANSPWPGREHINLLGFTFQGLHPDFTFDIEACYGPDIMAAIMGVTVFPVHWISLRWQTQWMHGGLLLPPAYSLMAQWKGTRHFSQYAGIHASWGKGWHAQTGHRISRKQGLRYEKPAISWEIRHWLRLQYQEESTILYLSAVQVKRANFDRADALDGWPGSRHARLQLRYDLTSGSALKWVVQFSQAGDFNSWDDWGSAIQMGWKSKFVGQGRRSFFVDLCFSDIEDANARLTVMMMNPDGGLAMTSLYHRSVMANTGLELRYPGGLQVWTGLSGRYILHPEDGIKYRTELMLRVRFEKTAILETPWDEPFPSP